MGRIENGKAHAAGKVAGIDYRDILKGLGRLQGVLVSLADMLRHGDMNHVLRLRQFLCEKAFIILHIWGLGDALLAPRHVGQQLIRHQL